VGVCVAAPKARSGEVEYAILVPRNRKAAIARVKTIPKPNDLLLMFIQSSFCQFHVPGVIDSDNPHGKG
jgi:hypothetical protein